MGAIYTGSCSCTFVDARASLDRGVRSRGPPSHSGSSPQGLLLQAVFLCSVWTYTCTQTCQEPQGQIWLPRKVMSGPLGWVGRGQTMDCITHKAYTSIPLMVIRIPSWLEGKQTLVGMQGVQEREEAPLPCFSRSNLVWVQVIKA